MSKIVQLKKEGINEYPITMPEAVIDSDGITVKDKIKALEDKIENIKPGSDPYDDTEIKNQLNNKIEKGSLATINGQTIENGGNIVIESGQGGSSVIPDWNANEGEEGYIKNRTHYAGAKVVYDEVNLEEPDYNAGLLIPYYDGIENDKFYIEYNICEWGYGADDLEIINQFSGITEFDVNSNLNLLEVFDDQGWDTQCFIEDRDGGFYISVNSAGDGFTGTIKVYKIGGVKQLGEEYIPSTIARQSDLAELSERVGALEGGGGGSSSKSQFQIYKENGGSFYETEEQYNLYTALLNNPNNWFTRSINGPLTSGNYTWEDYGITNNTILSLIYYSRFTSDSFEFVVTDLNTEEEFTFYRKELNNGYITLLPDRGATKLYIYLDGRVSFVN